MAADSFAASVGSLKTAPAGNRNDDADDDALEQFAAMLETADTAGHTRPVKTLHQVTTVEIEDRGRTAPEVQNIVKAIDLVSAAEVNALQAGTLTNGEIAAADMGSGGYKNDNGTEMQKTRIDEDAKINLAAGTHKCDADCTHDENESCSAACRKWKGEWDPIMKLIADACNDSAAMFNSSPSPTVAARLTTMQSAFTGLVSRLEKSAAVANMNQDEFTQHAYNVLCNDIGREFHQMRTTICGQLCCFNEANSKFDKMCRRVMSTIARKDDDDGVCAWMAQSPLQLCKHIAKCTPQQLVAHVKTMDETASQLAVTETELFRLAGGCVSVIKHLRAQIKALRKAMPVPKKPKSAPSDVKWTRVPPTENESNLDVWGEATFAHANCDVDKFLMCLRAFLDTEPDCRRLVYDGAVFFRDCCQNLVWYMERHIERAKRMSTAFNSLGEALVQQRFIVHIGEYMLRILAKMPPRARHDTGRKETPIDVFRYLFGPQFRAKMPDSQFQQIQIEIDSNGVKLPGTLRTYVLEVYVPRHLNAIQKAARALFTAELDGLGEILSRTKHLDTTGLIVSGGGGGDSSSKKSSITKLHRLVQAALKYIDKQHPCQTKHCGCCHHTQTAKSSSSSSLKK